MSLRIIIDGEALDLFDDQANDFYITKLIHDIRDLETRNGSYSKTILIPDTLTNSRLLGANIPGFSRFTLNGTQFVPCQVFMNDVEIFDSASIRVERGTRTSYEITVFSGVVGFFYGLKEQSLRDLDWRELDITWNEAYINSIVNNEFGDGVVFTDALWVSNESFREYLGDGGDPAAESQDNPQLYASGVFMYVRYVLDKIFATLPGYTVDYSELGADPLLNRIAFAMPVTAFAKPKEVPDVQGISNINVASLDGNLSEVVVPMVEDSKTGNMSFIAANNLWLINVGFSATIQLNLRVTRTYRNEGTLIRFDIMKNLEVLASKQLSTGTTSFAINLDLRIDTVQLNELDQIWVRLSTGRNVNSADETGAVGTVQPDSKLTIDVFGGTTNDIRLGQYMPDVDQRDFVRAAFQLFNIVMIEESRVVKLKYWEDIMTTPTISLEIDRDSSFEESGILDEYAQVNTFKYENDNVEREDTDGTIRVNASNPEEFKDKIENIFSASDEVISLGGKDDERVTIPAYEIERTAQAQPSDGAAAVTFSGAQYLTDESSELKLNTYLYDSTNNLFRRVITFFDNKSGVATAGGVNADDYVAIAFDVAEIDPLHLVEIIQNNSSYTVEDGEGGFSVPAANKIARFTDNLRWTRLIEDYYRNLANSLFVPYSVNAWFNLSLSDFVRLNGLTPIYVPSLGAKFYVNKIEQFRPNELTRLELFRIGDQNVQPLTGSSGDLPDTPLDFSDGFSDGFRTKISL